jgi:hypothetical protein
VTDTHERELPGCARVLRSAEVDPIGSATGMGGWLMVEHPGPWPRDVVDQVFDAALPAARRRELERLRAAKALRPLLVRRPGRWTGAGVRVMVGGSGPGQNGRPWLEALVLRDADELPAQLARLDLAAVLAAGTAGWRPLAGPLFLVCTHGTKDMCCATEGRPIATALAARHPGLVWETTHLGGDRWAANLLTVPDGYLHGHVDAAQAARVADAALAGQVELERLRGRTALAPWAQAAEVAVRRKTGRSGVGAVTVTGAEEAGGDEYLVAVDAGPEHWLVTVRREALGACGTSRCAGVLRPSAWLATHLEPAPAATVA